MDKQKEAIEELDEALEEYDNKEAMFIVEIDTKEKCNCGISWRILEDLKENKVYYICRAEECEDFFVSTEEYYKDKKGLNGRRNM